MWLFSEVGFEQIWLPLCLRPFVQTILSNFLLFYVNTYYFRLRIWHSSEVGNICKYERTLTKVSFLSIFGGSVIVQLDEIIHTIVYNSSVAKRRPSMSKMTCLTFARSWAQFWTTFGSDIFVFLCTICRFLASKKPRH